MRGYTKDLRRCFAVSRQTGRRCFEHAVTGSMYCEQHQRIERRLNGTDHLGPHHVPATIYQFKDKALQDTYERHATNPDRLNLAGELALVRLCLESVVRKTGDSKLEELSPSLISVLTNLVRETTSVIDAVARIEKTTESVVHVDQIMIVVDEIAQIALKYVPADQAGAFKAELRAMVLPTTSPDDHKQRRLKTQLNQAAWQGFEDQDGTGPDGVGHSEEGGDECS